MVGDGAGERGVGILERDTRSFIFNCRWVQGPGRQPLIRPTGVTGSRKSRLGTACTQSGKSLLPKGVSDFIRPRVSGGTLIVSASRYIPSGKDWVLELPPVLRVYTSVSTHFLFLLGSDLLSHFSSKIFSMFSP